MATNVFVNAQQVPEGTFRVYRQGFNMVEITGVQGIGCDVRQDGSLVVTLNSLPLVVFGRGTWDGVNVLQVAAGAPAAAGP